MTNQALTTATEDQITQIRRHAVNDVTREIMAHGVKLTWAQADDLGDETIAWMGGRLGLNKRTTDKGITFTPPEHHVSQDAASRLKAIRKSLSTVELDLTWERDTDTDGGLVAETTGQSTYDVNELVSYLKTMGHEVSKSQDGKQSWIWVA